MTARTALAAACFSVGPLLGLGCSGPSHEFQSASDQGLVRTDHVGLNEIRPAVTELCAKISEINRQGWPDHVRLTPDPPRRPQVRIAEIENRTTQWFDVETLRNELSNAMVEQEVVYVVAGEDDLEAVMQEREYSQSGMTAEQLDYGQEDVVALVLTGQITDDFITRGGVQQHDYYFSLRLTDTVKARRIAESSTKIRKVRRN